MAATTLFVPAAPAQDGEEGDRVYPVNQWIVGMYRVPMTMSGELHGAKVVQVDYELQWVLVQVVDPTFFVKAQLDPNVRYLEWDNPNYGALSFVPNDSQYSSAGHYGSKKINGEAAWDRTLGTTAVKVGMVDTGVWRTHEDLTGGRVLQGFDFYNNDNDPADAGGSCSYHGTHTTGTAGATINNAKGIAGMSQHTIIPIKAFGGSLCGGSTSALANGMRYVRDQGGHVSSNSWGSSAASTTFNDAINYAHAGGVIHVAAAGNSGPCTNCVSYPWKSVPSIVIVVASTTSTDTQSSFSSEGAEVDVAAPGSSILSLCGGTNTCYQTLSGTSMATPHVAGATALMKARDGTMDFTEAQNCLRSTALDLGAAGVDHDFGAGRIRADQAIDCVGGAPPPAAACGDGVDNDGDGLTDYPADPGCTSASDTDEFNAPPPTGDALNENFDDGVANGWALSGLWRISGACTSTEPTAPNVLNYNQAPSPCTYATGARTTGNADTPAMDLSGRSTATLTFSTGYIKENYAGGAYDIMRVQASSNGGSTWTTLWQRDSRNADQTTWTTVSLDLTAYRATNSKVRFNFDSVDGISNSYLGWVVDTVRVA